MRNLKLYKVQALLEIDETLYVEAESEEQAAEYAAANPDQFIEDGDGAWNITEVQEVQGDDMPKGFIYRRAS